MAVPLKIFIAGATGFIGRHLITAFQAHGHDVYGLARDRMRGKILEEMGCKPIIGNLLTNGPWERAIEYFDIAIGCTKPGKRGQAPTMAQVPELLKSHTDACSHLINAVHDGKLRGLILTFGALSYGNRGDEWVDENTDFDPVGYGRIIGASRPTLVHFAESKRIRATFIVPGWVYGQGGWFTEQLVPAIKEGRAHVVGSGDNYMSLVHARDMAEAYVLAAEEIGYAPPPPERPQVQIVNVTDDEPVTQRQWMSAVCKAMGKPEPPSMSIEDSIKQTGELLTESIACSTRMKNEAAKERFGWKLQFPTIREGIPAVLAAAK